MSIKYRSDIDGLRAIAVVSVIIFHYFPTWLPGGFIGVDIFFVISGFLIGTIIVSEIKNRNFSFLQFYKRRALRIFPALITVLLFCYFIGWTSLYQHEFAELGKHISAGAGFISNLVLWSEAGYFDTSSALKPLLHLWSLGVEEQFYIVSPILLILGFRFKINFLKICSTLIILSFVYCLFTMLNDKTANYYSPLSRLWELMFGVLLAVAKIESSRFNETSDKYKNFISAAGFILVIVSLAFIDEKMAFPGYIALLPVLGSCCIIAAGKNAFLNSKILSLRIMVAVGLISYPLYLWHWPTITFAKIIHGSDLNTNIKIYALAAAILLSALTYFIIEKPIRFGLKIKSSYKASFLSGLLFAVCCGGFYTYINGGVESRQFNKINISRETAYGISLDNSLDGCGISEENAKIIPYCQHDRRGNSVYALIGDSKSMALYGGVMETALKDKYWLYLGGNSSTNPPRIVMPVFTNDPRYTIYQSASKAVVDELSKNKEVKVVVYTIATRAIFQLNTDESIEQLPNTKDYSLVLKGLSVGVDQLIKAGKKVLFVIDNPTLPHPESCSGRKSTLSLVNKELLTDNLKCSISVNKQLELSAIYRNLLNEIKNRYPEKVFLFDTIPFMCTKDTCSHTKDGHFMYSSGDHISGYAAEIIGASLNKYLATITN